MAGTYKGTIDHALELTNEWVFQLDDLLDWDNPDQSYRLLYATLQTLRDVLPHIEAAQLSAQFPTFIRGLFYAGWNPARTPVKKRSKTNFIAQVSSRFAPYSLGDPEGSIATVFALLTMRISGGEIDDIRGSLKPELADLWLPPELVVNGV